MSGGVRISELQEVPVSADTDLFLMESAGGVTYKAPLSKFKGVSANHPHVVANITDFASATTSAINSQVPTLVTSGINSQVPTLVTSGINGTVPGLITTATSALKANEQDITANWNLLGATYKRVDLGSVSGGVALNLSLGMFFTLTATGDITFSLSNVKSGTVVSTLGLKISAASVYVINWPASVKWPDTAPTLTAGKSHVFTFLTDDNGTTWYNIGQTIV
jgi:hypothetical protein